MTTWNETTSNQTNWIGTLNTVRIIEFIDNSYNINYALADLNGRSFSYWNNQSTIQSSWRGDSPYSVTTTFAYPIGITLVFTGNISTTTTYPTTSDMEWSGTINNQTAWR